MRQAGHVTYMGESNACRISVRKPEGRRSLIRPERRWKHNKNESYRNRMGSMDWTNLAQDGEQRRALVNTAMNK
jgi:hypothetical protein